LLTIAEVTAQLRAGPLWSDDVLCSAGGFGFDKLKELLPHRPPFLLLDRVEQFDSSCKRLWAVKQILGSDPNLSPHRSGDSTYPNVLLIECMGQAAVCLLSLLGHFGMKPPSVRLARLHHALFIKPVRPPVDIDIHVALVESRSRIDRFAGQIWVGSQLCSLAIGDLHLLR